MSAPPRRRKIGQSVISWLVSELRRVNFEPRKGPSHSSKEMSSSCSNNNEFVIEQDIFPLGKKPSGEASAKYENDDHSVEMEKQSGDGLQIQFWRSRKLGKETDKGYGNQSRLSSLFRSRKEGGSKDVKIRSRNFVVRFAYEHMASKLPRLPGYREAYEQSGIPLIWESYLSTAFLVSGLVTIPVFLVSLLLESGVLHLSLIAAFLGSFILSSILFAVSLLIWLMFPLQRRKSFKTKLDNQLAYSFGILGVLAAAGMNVDRLFERLASSESNPVLAELAKRFLRNVRLFGLDTETALREVAAHSPSSAFSKMLESIAVAFKTTGSIHDLVMFESARLFEEKRSKLTKTIGNLGVMAELYITLVVVGPIIFIVMMAIFSLLPSGGLPDPILVINILVFIGVPAISAMFILMLDSAVAKV